MVAILAISGVLLLTIAGAVYDGLQTVEEGELKALLVFGEMEAVLEPGLSFVPPFVSKTYPIDPQTMTIDTDDDRIAVPAEFESAVQAATER
ncbi:SPFH domain-containing protein [Halopiger aswanensis]|uniref:SPFH domain/Band 7 family protein n=1 Tax=Halopiger aswanensis TaxID=148449 RepID=A0A419WEV9_9EURY|nr:SPFH domain-containing protein [Halopiger aswanensis]RKD94034.1 SPFH domain/Band 7 family protein [Halopiger aswanensis]